VGGSVLLVEGLGDGVLTGGLNVFQYLAYVISMALYAAGFAGYAMTFLPDDTPSFVPRLLGAGIILLFAGVNLLGSRFVGRAESVIVIVKVTILVVFIVGAFFSTMFVLLMVYILRKAPAAAWITLLATLGAAFAIEVAYRARTGRRYRTLAQGAAAPAPVVTVATVATST
jgi:amino acid transporter